MIYAGITGLYIGRNRKGEHMKKNTDIKTTVTLKKILCGMLSAAMIVTSMPIGALAAEAGSADAFAGITEEAEAEVIIDAEQFAETGAAVTAEADEIIALGDGEEGGETTTEQPAATEVGRVEINQGFSAHTGLNDGNETYMNDFVAKKQTAVIVKIPGSDDFTEDQAKSAVANFKLEAKAVTGGQESDNCELTASGENFSVKRAYDKDCDVVKGWYATANFPTGPDKGTYNFHVKNGDTEIATSNGVNFYETKPLNILVVPVNGYWGKHYEGAAPSAGAFSCKNGTFKDPLGNDKEWSSLCTELKTYLLDVYPIAEVNFEEGNELEAGTKDYDMCNDDGQRKLWEEACKLQSKTKDGKDRYDLILAFVQYRQDQGSGQGYTYGKPTNIITYSDVDMLPTVAHEIAHCYQVGDEYDGGSFNSNVNFPPNGYSGRDFVSGANISSSSGASDYWMSPKQYKSKNSSGKNSKININGAGTMVPLSLHPYSLSQEKFITWGGVDAAGNATASQIGPTISWMGSGYAGCDGYYWTTSVIWDHLFKNFVTKEKKDTSSQQPAEEETEQTEETQDSSEAENSNADVYINALMSGEEDENSIFSEDDFYYDDDCRWGDSRMVEVEGWLTKDKAAATGVKAQVAPMFSYDGDLEYIELLEDIYKDSQDVYTFAALDANGKVIKSPVDGEWAVAEFYGGFFNPRGKAGVNDEVHFRFDAEYPEGTADFVIVKGKVEDDGTYKGAVVWQATKAEEFIGEFDKYPEGELLYADVNADTAEVMWDVYYKDQLYSEPTDDALLYTEVYYCPQGDDGEAYYLGCSLDDDWTEGYIGFDMSEFKSEWTRNAYIWIKVSNGVNAIDIYSDENDVTLSNSVITLSGAGIKSSKEGGEVTYTAECTGSAITPKVDVKAYNPETGKYIGLKNGVDYEVSYSDNVQAGWATVSVQGIGSYAGKNTVEFEIVKKTLNATPENIPNMVYSTNLDKDIQKYLVLTDKNNNRLVYDTDFTVKYSADGKTKSTLAKLIPAPANGTVTVTVTYTGKGNYTGENKTKATFNVLPDATGTTDLSNAKVTLKTESAEYTGKPIKPAVARVELDGKAVKASDYKVVYSGNTNVGTGRVTVVGKNSYTGSAAQTFAITPKKVKSISVSGIKNQPYTGSAIAVDSLPIVVKAGKIVLTKDVDYTVNTVEGCDYTNVTTKANKSQMPKIEIKLISQADAVAANKKPSEYPKVEWDAKAKTTTITKSFSIIQTKLTSNAVSFGTKSSSVDKNIVKNADGSAKIGTMRKASKADHESYNGKYAYVINGTADELAKDASLAEAISLTAFGKDISKDATVSITKTKSGKVGTITIKANKGTGISGKITAKFLYLKDEPVTEDVPESEKPEPDVTQ